VLRLQPGPVQVLQGQVAVAHPVEPVGGIGEELATAAVEPVRPERLSGQDRRQRSRPVVLLRQSPRPFPPDVGSHPDVPDDLRGCFGLGEARFGFLVPGCLIQYLGPECKDDRALLPPVGNHLQGLVHGSDRLVKSAPVGVHPATEYYESVGQPAPQPLVPVAAGSHRQLVGGDRQVLVVVVPGGDSPQRVEQPGPGPFLGEGRLAEYCGRQRLGALRIVVAD
jgi:hypothetical protein